LSAASHAIASLDRHLTGKGEDVILRHEDFNTGRQEAPCRAFIRGYKPTELVGGIDQHSSNVIISPTSLKGTGLTPAEGDYVISGGRTRYVETVEFLRIGTEIVRIELTVTG
jgi:hypothetical protein